eukprot:Sdes_comp18428_c0_seq1m8328
MSLFYFKTFNFKINSHFDSRLLNSSTLIQSRSFHSSLIGFHQAKNVQHKTKLTKKIIHSVSGKCLSSTNWLRRKLSDRYCFEAITSNYRSRSAFKLLQMNQKFQFLKKGFTVIDLGSAPGKLRFFLHSSPRLHPTISLCFASDFFSFQEVGVK